MKFKSYVNENQNVSRLGFGAWPLGNTAHGQTMTDEQGIDLVIKAYQMGINFFDTAPNYSNGKSEIILGKALVGIRDQVIINTKFGHHENGLIDFDASKIESSVKKSLKRLQTHYLDSVILHNPSHDILSGKTDHFNKLQSLKHKGLIRGYGVSIDTKEELELTLTYLKVDVIELLYNVFFQSTRSYLSKIKENHITLVIKVPLDSGWLSGKYDKDSMFTDIRKRWSKEDKKRRDDLLNKLKDITKDSELTKYAMGFLYAYDEITTVIPGIRNEDQLIEHVKYLDFNFKQQKAFEDFYDNYIEDNPLPW